MSRIRARSDSVERTRLANGLRVVVCRDRRAPLVVTRLAVQAGAREEPADRCGLAHLCEHLACDGPTNAPEAGLPERVRRLGGASNGWIFHDYAAFGTTVPSRAAAAALRLDAERLAWRPAQVSDDRLRTEAETLLQERHDRGGVPFAPELEYVHRLLYPATHPYHRPAIGMPDGLRAITRDDATGFAAACYQPNRTAIIAVGDVDIETLTRHAREAFAAGAHVPAGSARSVAMPADAALTALGPIEQATPARIALDVPYVRTYLAIRAPGHGTRGWHAMSVLARWLGTGRSNPFHRRLVDMSGLAHDVRVCWESFRDASTLAFVCTAPPETSPERLEHALAHALDDAIADGPLATDLERARTKALIDYYAHFDSIETRADWLAAMAMLRPDAADAETTRGDVSDAAESDADPDDDRLAAVTADDILDAARALALPHQRVWLSLTPRRAE
jgi:zinc protease